MDPEVRPKACSVAVSKVAVARTDAASPVEVAGGTPTPEARGTNPAGHEGGNLKDDDDDGNLLPSPCQYEAAEEDDEEGLGALVLGDITMN